jgi:hypothetical protein
MKSIEKKKVFKGLLIVLTSKEISPQADVRLSKKRDKGTLFKDNKIKMKRGLKVKITAMPPSSRGLMSQT